MDLKIEKYEESPRVRLFTHTDLDGVGCAIVARVAFDDVETTYHNYDKIDEAVTNFITSGDYLAYTHVFITDISLKKEVADLIEEVYEEGTNTMFKLLDHHATASWMNDHYDWAFVNPHGMTGKNSGTNMLYDYLKMTDTLPVGKSFSDPLEVFVEKVRRYDTWEWKEIYDDTEASSLNDLFWLYGINNFVERFVKRFKHMEIGIVSEGSWVGMFDKQDIAILGVDYDKKVAYINKKDKQMISGKLLGKKAGFVFAEQYISELGNELSTRHEELDFIVIMDLGAKRVSYRTVKEDIDLGKDVAKVFGGGGHSKASGSQIDLEITKLMIPLVFASPKLKQHLINVIVKRGFIGKLTKFIDKFSRN